MNDEKTTEIELPQSVHHNIVRVNFTERRKANRTEKSASAALQKPAPAYTLRPPQARRRAEWSTPWWVRLTALAAILILSLFVL